MTYDLGVVFAVVALLGVNQLVMRVERLWRSLPVFVALWASLVGLGTWVLAVGLPGFDEVPAVRWVVGLVLFVHAAQDLSMRSRRLAADAEGEEDETKAQIRAGLR